MLELINVQKDYGRFKLNCSLEVKAGCVTGLIGQNGAGKSTTFKAVLGLISVDSGTVKLFSKDIKRLSIEDKQKFYIQDDNIVVYFDLYDIAPYAAGIPEFIINVNKIDHILKPEYKEIFK